MPAGDVRERLQQALGDAYVIAGEIGRGGMAVVFRALDRKHDRPVALKVLVSDFAQSLGPERFRREIRLAAGLQHPHIVPVFDSGEAAGILWFTMPLVAGESLRDRLARERQLPVADAVRITRDVARALDYAHRHGVVHRDVKPENVLLTDDGQTLLADFGIARAAAAASTDTAPAGGALSGGTLTRAGVSVGTPAYMSPEQGAGEADVDGRSDQYALACVLFECLAGEPPFSGSTPQAVLAKRFAGPAPDVGILRDGVAPGVRAALARALARSRVDRFPTAAAFEAALAGVDQVGAVPVDTPPAAMPARPRGRRRLAIAAGLGLAGLTLAAAALRRAQNGRARVAPATLARAPADSAPAPGRQLTFSGFAQDPSFSPDGRQVAYVEIHCDSDNTAGGCGAELRVQDVRSSQSAVLARAHSLLHPLWTADGAWVLVAMRPAGGEFETYVVPSLGGAPRRLGPHGLVALGGTGDTVLLAATWARGTARFVRRLRAATGETLDSTPLAPAIAGLWGLLPSPDGRRVVLLLGGRLLLATPDWRVTDSLVFRSTGALRWDPRGNALYAVTPGVGTNIWLVRVRVDGRRGRFIGGVDTVVHLGSSPGYAFDIASDGRTLAYTGGTSATTLWALEPDARPPRRRLAASTAWLGDPQLSSDGQFVAYTKTDQAGDNVYVMPFAGPPAQPVTHDATGWEVGRWVPGGHSVTYAHGARPSPLYAQEFPGGPRRVIGRADALPFADGGTVEFDVPGRRLLFSAADGAPGAVALPDSLGAILELWGVDADGGSAYLQVLRAAAGVPPHFQIVRVDRGSGALTTVVDLPTAPAPYLLAVERGVMDYATWRRGPDGGRPTVWRVRPGRPAARVATLASACDQATLTMSADGRRFACAERTERPDVFLLEHFDRYRR
jgi:serine/threonine-protein kinase